MSADVRRFPERTGVRVQASLERIFSFVTRRATRNRIDDKLTRLETFSPDAFASVAARVEAIVDEALTALSHSQPRSSQRPASRYRLRWVVAALIIVVALIALGQRLAEVWRPTG